MARLIVKSPYLKCGGSNSVSGYLRYIGTRERVELLPDDRPPTRKQEQLITKLVKDFPDAQKLDEYSDYKVKPTKANASAFITRALEENWSAVQQSDGYMKYIAIVMIKKIISVNVFLLFIFSLSYYLLLSHLPLSIYALDG